MAGGIAHRLGVDPVLVRVGFAVLAFAGGTGVALYGLLWALLPLETPGGSPRPTATVQQGVALWLMLLGGLLLLRAIGLWFGDGIVLPVVVAGMGSVIVWTRADDGRRDRFSTRSTGAISAAAGAPVSPVRIVIGTLLVTLALAVFLAANDALVALRDLAITLVAAATGLGMLLGPWAWRLWSQLGAERRERIRQEERAELAAHLHDSVLQTLALIQRSADQPRRMVALARRQERELRHWLYGSSGTAGRPTTLQDAVAVLIEEIEAAHELTVEAVVVGTAPIGPHALALLAAMREGLVNVGKHAGVTEADLYLEVDGTELLAFVRDRGRGFDPTEVPSDRQGLRRSVTERLSRHGGSARIHAAPGQGTELELTVPIDRQEDDT